MGPTTRRRISVVSAGSAAVMLALLLQSCSSSPGPSATIAAYLSAWARRDYSAMAALVVRPPRDFVTFNRQVADDLDLERATYGAGTATTNGSDATTPVTAHLVLVPFGALAVHATLHLSDAGVWRRVVWSPRSIHLRPRARRRRLDHRHVAAARRHRGGGRRRPSR